MRRVSDDEPDLCTDHLADAGSYGKRVTKAATWAELPAEAVAALSAAANVAERHMYGYGPADGDVGRLATALTAFVAAMRERARAEREAA